MSHSNCDLVATWQLAGSGHEQKFRAQFATRDTFPSRALGNGGVISEFSVVRPHSWILVSRANLAACLSQWLEFAGPGGESGGESLAGNSYRRSQTDLPEWNGKWLPARPATRSKFGYRTHGRAELIGSCVIIVVWLFKALVILRLLFRPGLKSFV